jgi:hypothetical protein
MDPSLRARVVPSLDALSAEARFEVITAWDVLEHLPDPDATLRSLRARLTPDGVLAVVIPVIGSSTTRLAPAAGISTSPRSTCGSGAPGRCARCSPTTASVWCARTSPGAAPRASSTPTAPRARPSCASRALDALGHRALAAVAGPHARHRLRRLLRAGGAHREARPPRALGRPRRHRGRRRHARRPRRAARPPVQPSTSPSTAGSRRPAPSPARRGCAGPCALAPPTSSTPTSRGPTASARPSSPPAVDRSWSPSTCSLAEGAAWPRDRLSGLDARTIDPPRRGARPHPLDRPLHATTPPASGRSGCARRVIRNAPPPPRPATQPFAWPDGARARRLRRPARPAEGLRPHAPRARPAHSRAPLALGHRGRRARARRAHSPSATRWDYVTG